MRGPRAVSRLILALTPTWFAIVPAVVGRGSRIAAGTTAQVPRNGASAAGQRKDYPSMAEQWRMVIFNVHAIRTRMIERYPVVMA